MADLSPYWDKWPYLSEEEIRAEDVLRTCFRKRRMASIPVPVPVEELIEGPLRLRLDVCDLSRYGENVIGSASCEKPMTISVSDRIENQDGRFRFTLAHELGHIVMHRYRANRFEDGEKTMLVQDYGLEAEANRFASGFLMPWSLLEPEMMRIFHEFGMDPRKYLGIMPQDNTYSVWVWKHRILPRITQRFDVSLSAAIYRFTSIRLPDGDGFLPRAIVSDLMTSGFSIRRPLRDALLMVAR